MSGLKFTLSDVSSFLPDNLSGLKKSHIKDTHWEKILSNKTQALTKSRNTGIWVVATSNELFIRTSETETKFSKKEKKSSYW